MIDKQQYQRTFGVLHASGDFLKEELPMKAPKKHVPMRKAVLVCAVLALIFSLGTACYAADVGGIRRTVQVWIHGEQTDAVMDVQNGQYTLQIKDADGTVHEQGGGGVAFNPDGSERPLTEEELMEHLDSPDVEENDDGTVWVYYREQAMEITDLFDENGICFLELKDGEDILYLTVKKGNGYAFSPSGYVQPYEFNTTRP